MRTRYELIQYFINLISAQHYLEIGLDKGDAFMRIKCPNKYTVDIKVTTRANLTAHYFEMTSDEFFAEQRIPALDVCFIDGLHHADQVIRDFENARDLMNNEGVIVFHDCLPRIRACQTVPESPETGGEWNGDVWKAFVSVIHTYENHNAEIAPFTMNFDFGCGVVILDKNVTANTHLQPLSWADYEPNRLELLNVQDLSYLMAIPLDKIIASPLEDK